MASKSDEITSVLKELKSAHNEINACMVAKRGLEGVIMFPESFKQEVVGLWEPLGKTIDDVLAIVSEKGSYQLDRAYFDMLGYGVSFHVLADSDTALIVIMQHAGKNDPMAFVVDKLKEICSVRDKIVKIIESP